MNDCSYVYASCKWMSTTKQGFMFDRRQIPVFWRSPWVGKGECGRITTETYIFFPNYHINEKNLRKDKIIDVSVVITPESVRFCGISGHTRQTINGHVAHSLPQLLWGQGKGCFIKTWGWLNLPFVFFGVAAF